MGVIKGLSVDGVTYFGDLLSGAKKPDWMEFSTQIAKLTGNYGILNYMTGYANLSQFIFRMPRWPIGAMYFDGILHTEHVSRVRPTQYPVQTGVTMTDHAIIEPAELSIEVMMTDAATNIFVSTHPILNAFYKAMRGMGPYSNIRPFMGKMKPVTLAGDGRAAEAWMSLKAMQMSRVPLTVETRLQTYKNMIIEELSAPDDAKTMHALKCTVRLREIVFADVAKTETSARAAASAEESSSGNVPVETEPNNTALKDILEAGGGILS